MCVAAQLADFRGTRLMLNITDHSKHGKIAVLGYQNTAVNLHTGPNAMLLHLPAGKPMSQKNFIDATGCKHIFDDMKRAVTPVRRGMDYPIGSSGGDRSFVVFDHDIYTVVLAKDARDIPVALKQVPPEKRPFISRELCEFYFDSYFDHSIILCCFNNRDARKALPLLIWYNRPKADLQTLPAIDCHTGGVPDLEESVQVDHWVFVASDNMQNGSTVHYQDEAAQSKVMGTFLPKKVVGREFHGLHTNGDFGFKVSRLESSDFSTGDIMRIHPEW